MGISGLKSDMSAGKINPGIYRIEGGKWDAVTTQNGKDNVNWALTLIDTDDAEYPLNLFAGQQKYVSVNRKGQLESVDESRDFRISSGIGAGLFLASLNDAGASPKKLANIGDAPGAFDGQWVKIDTKPGTQTDSNGNPFMNIIVDALVDADDVPGAGKKKTSKKAGKPAPAPEPDDEDDEDEEEEEEEAPRSTKGKGGKRADTTTRKAAKPADEDEDDDTEDDEEDEDAADDDADTAVTEAATAATVAVLASLNTKTPLVKNYDPDSAAGGITVGQAYIASFSLLPKGDKKLKGAAAAAVNDPALHKMNAKAGLYLFDAKTGVITPTPAGKAKKGGK